MAKTAATSTSEVAAFAQLFARAAVSVQDFGYVFESDEEANSDMARDDAPDKGKRMLMIGSSSDDDIDTQTKARLRRKNNPLNVNNIHKLEGKIQAANATIAKIRRKITTDTSDKGAKQLRRWQHRLRHLEKLQAFLRT